MARRLGEELCPATPARARARGARPPRGPGPHPTRRGYCSRRGLDALWPSPRARCRPGVLTLGRRRTPALLRAPAAPSPLGTPAPFKPSSQAPRRAPPAICVPYRESPVPSPSWRRPRPSARGRGQNGRLASSHETKKPPLPPPSEGKPRARARRPRPPPPRHPRPRCARTRHLPSPPPLSASPASAARPVSCACPPALPLLERVRVGRGGGVGRGRGQRELAPRTHLPTLCGTRLRLRMGVVLRLPHVVRRHCSEHAQSGRHCGGGSGGGSDGGGGWLGDGTGWRQGLWGRGGRGALRPGSEDARQCLRGRGGEAGPEMSRAGLRVKGELRNRFHPW